MSKRGNENSQMRREEVDALDDEESSGGGAFERAAPEVLAQRRIIKLKRPTGDGPPKVLNFGVADNFASSTVGGAPAQSNPFGGFKGLSADATVAASTAPANPFGGFTGLIAPAPVAAANPFGGFTGLAAPAVAANPFGGFSGLIPSYKSSAGSFTNKAATASTTMNSIPSLKSTAPAVVESEYKRKMRKLNTSVSQWMDRQIVEHPLSIWKDGLKDYVRYSTDIAEKYGGNAEDTAATAESPSKVPFPDNKAPVSFTNFKSATVASNTPITSSVSSNFFTGFSMPAAPLSTADDKKVAVNWNVPGLSTEAKSIPAPFGSSSVPSFSFNALPTAPFGSLPAVTANSFSGGFTGFAPATNAPVGGADAEEDEGEPIMEAEKVLRNEEDKDDIIVDCNCKLHRFDTGKGDNGKGEWIDVGKGTFRVTKCTVTGKQRMLVRNSVGKIIFNAAFYKGMKVERKSSGKFSFGAVTDESGALKTFLLTVKSTDDAIVFSALQAAIATF